MIQGDGIGVAVEMLQRCRRDYMWDIGMHGDVVGGDVGNAVRML